MRICTVEHCERKVLARGWCNTHYSNWRRTGAPVLAQRPTLEDRLWAGVEVGDCWTWQGTTTRGGYGQIGGSTDGEVYAHYTHRLAYELLVGPIDSGLEIDHLCRNRACANPDHMELVTHAENLRRGHGIGVRNAAKTHCPQGHLYDEANTRIYRGARVCRVCDREARRVERAAHA